MLLNYQGKNSEQNQIESYLVWTEKTIRSSGKVEAIDSSITLAVLGVITIDPLLQKDKNALTDF